MTPSTTTPAGTAWDALGGSPELLERLSPASGPHPGPRSSGTLPARLPVRDMARACVSACSLAAAELAALRGESKTVPEVRVDDLAVAAAFTSERQLRVDGRAPVNFAPLSGFWRAADGWVRTHANYPHHRVRLTAVLGLPDDAGPEALAAAIATRSATALEDEVYAAGGLAVALRTPEQWAAHEQSAAARRQPLVRRTRIGDAPVRALPPPPDGGPLLPAAGLRVLDLTRVLAGPVSTRTLGLLGADVLRVDSPRLPELDDQHADTGFGKRSATLDLGSAADRRVFDELLASADVVVCGYRPGALDRFGLAPEALAERRPGLVVARLSAWGASGPWAGRRGFDSLVQVATGIAALEGSPDGPGALPAQALDHGTGYLIAGAVLRALTEQAADGGSRLVEFALARTAAWLVSGIDEPKTGAEAERDTGQETGPETGAGPARASGRAPGPEQAPGPVLAETDSALGRLRYAPSPVSFRGGPTDWTRSPSVWGTDAPVWL
jgi:crotonobetainyl-CoA:carnitine CoA-transferase CaiB-like acyl-CoA transferase